MLDMVNRSHCNPNGKNSRKSWKWMVLDSVIIGAIAMCAQMPDVIPALNDLWVMGKAFLIAFITQLAIERGLKKG